MPEMTTMREMTPVSAARGARNPLGACAGGGAGLAAGLCCAASAIVAGGRAGLGGVSFFAVRMHRYQPYAIAVTVLLLVWWLARTARALSAGRGGGPWWRRLGRAGLVHAAVCLGSCGLVLALAMGISAAVRGM